MQWYHVQDGERIGPLTDEELDQQIALGTVAAETLVWHEGMPDWASYGSLASGSTPETGLQVLDAGTGICCECGRTFNSDDMVQYEGSSICAECKPVFFQRVQEGALLPGTMVYAGFWIRFLAKFIDGLIIGAVNVVISFLAGLLIATVGSAGGPETAMVINFVLVGVQFAIRIAYNTFFVGRYGATPGKMACKLKVVRSNGETVSYGRACGRHFGEILSGLVLMIGYIMAAFDDEKRALHDRVCDTRVIHTG